MHRVAFPLLAVLLLAAGCASPGSDTPSGPPAVADTAGFLPEDVTGPPPDPAVVLGRVYRGGVPVTGYTVQLISDSMRQVATDRRGDFVLEDVAPGEYLLNIADAASFDAGMIITRARAITVEPGELIEIEEWFGDGVEVRCDVSGLPGPREETGVMHLISLRRPEGPSLAGEPLGDRSLQLEAAAHLEASAYVEADGRITLHDVRPGTYVLDLAPLPTGSESPTDVWPAVIHRSTVEVGEVPLEITVSVGEIDRGD